MTLSLKSSVTANRQASDRKASDRPVMQTGAAVVTHAKMQQWVVRLGSHLSIKPESEPRHLMNLCGNRLAFAVAFQVVVGARAINVLPHNQSPDTLHYLVEQYYVDTILIDDGTSANVIEELQRLCAVKFFNVSEYIEHKLLPVVADVDCERLLEEVNTPAAVVFTSGSTGVPQPLYKSWTSLCAMGCQESHWFASLVTDRGVAESETINVVATVPAQHMYGLESSIFTALCGQVCAHIQQPFFPADIAAALQNCPEPRVLVTTPAHLRVLARSQSLLPKVAAIISATAPLDTALAQQVERQLGTQVHEIYGFSEAGAIAHRRTVAANGSESWQLFPNLSLRAKKHNHDVDSIEVYGGHLSAPETLPDNVEMLSQRSFLLHGRHADMLNFGGKRASLAGINQILLNLPEVEDGVIFQPDSRNRGSSSSVRSQLVALVVSETLSPAKINQQLARFIDPLYVPKITRIVQALPRNAAGKLPSEALHKLWQQSGG